MINILVSDIKRILELCKRNRLEHHWLNTKPEFREILSKETEEMIVVIKDAINRWENDKQDNNNCY